jgi:hypothetical protein
VLVTGIEADCPAATAGLETQDIIVERGELPLAGPVVLLLLGEGRIDRHADEVKIRNLPAFLPWASGT